MKPYLTKVGVGSHWRYVDTKRPYRFVGKVMGLWIIVVSYKKVRD